MSNPIFEVRDLSYGTPDGRLLQEDLSFNLKNGQMLLITGSNGCGKSTLLKTLLGKLAPQKGSIRCTITQSKIEYMPQLENTEIHFPLTLGDVLSISGGKSPSFEAISSFNLLRRDHLKTAWNSASGGERKRTLLTRALLKTPSLLVFDEPMNHLDSESRRAMVQVLGRYLKEANQKQQRAIVMVCHQGLYQSEGHLFDTLHLDLNEARLSKEHIC